MIKSTKTESKSHILGKELAKNLLRAKMFRDGEIKEEYPVIFPTGKIRIIDVVGINMNFNKKIAFEVGNLHGGSLEELYLFFDEVQNIEKLEIESENLEKVLNYFYRIIDEYEEDKERAIDYLDFSCEEDIKILNINKDESIYFFNNFIRKNSIDLDMIKKYVLEEIEFLYKNISLSSEQYGKIKSRLINWYIKNTEEALYRINYFRDYY
jgi:hypothetical protein